MTKRNLVTRCCLLINREFENGRYYLREWAESPIDRPLTQGGTNLLAQRLVAGFGVILAVTEKT